MSKAFFMNLLREQPSWIRLIVEFNLLPACYIHRTWVEHLATPELFEALKLQPRARARLSRMLLSEYGLERAYCFDFEEKRRRVALVDGPTLEKLLWFAGIVLNAAKIVRTVDRASVLMYRKALGSEGYFFAVKRAPFLVGPHATALGESDSGDDFRMHIMSCGAACLAACMAGDPPALKDRLRLKLPKEYASHFRGLIRSERKRETAWTVLRKVLTKEVAVHWAPFF